MHMRMMGERRSPGMQHSRDGDPGAEMLGIGGNGEHGLGRRLEQKAINFRLVLPCDGADRRGQREHHMVIGQRQKLGLAIGKPLAGGGALTLRAVPIAAGVVADDGMGAVFASRNMAAKLRRAAGFDGGHCFQLAEAQCPALALRQAAPWLRKISATSSAGRGMAQGAQALGSSFFSIRLSRSKGLITLRIVVVATRV